jgi:hypothetical protein
MQERGSRNRPGGLHGLIYGLFKHMVWPKEVSRISQGVSEARSSGSAPLQARAEISTRIDLSLTHPADWSDCMARGAYERFSQYSWCWRRSGCCDPNRLRQLMGFRLSQELMTILLYFVMEISFSRTCDYSEQIVCLFSGKWGHVG